MRNTNLFFTLCFGIFVIFTSSCSQQDETFKIISETQEQSLFSQDYIVAKHAFSDGRRAKTFRIFPEKPGFYYVIKMPENDTIQLTNICHTKPGPHFNIFEEKWEITPRDIMVDDNDFIAVDTLNSKKKSDGIFDQITKLSKENSTDTNLIESE